MGTDILKEQYNLLLENQKKKIKKLQDKRVATSKINNFIENEEAIERDIDKLNEEDFLESDSDDLNINAKITSVNKKNETSSKNSVKSSTSIKHESNALRESLSFSDKLREMKDENGRLRKLLSEKEYEINYLKKKLEEEKLAFTGGAIGSDAIATKIVDLSKRIRELNAELESERTKNKQLSKNCKDLEYKLSTNSGKNRPNDDDDEEEEVNDTQRLSKENKELKDKLSQTSGKLMEFKSQCEILKQDLKQHQRALEKEVGENFDVKAILNGQSNWKGRQQQIRSLQNKLSDLKQQLGMMDSRNTNEMTIEEEFESAFMRGGDMGGLNSGLKSEHASMLSFGTTKRSALDVKNREEIKRIEKEKKEQVEKVKREYEALENDYNSVKSKTDAFKARNTVLTNEVKTTKEQIKTLLEKGKHDDELIEALLQKQTQMKVIIDDLTTKNETLNKELDEKNKEVQVKGMQDKNVIDQLKAILSEREKKVKQLEDEIQMTQFREKSSHQLQFILHNNGNKDNNHQSNSISGILNDDNERLGSSLSNRNNSRNEFASTRLGSAPSGNNNIVVNNNNNLNTSNGRLSSGRDIAATRQALKGTKINSRPNSANGNNNSYKKEYEELKQKYHELVTLNKSSDIERIRLFELVKTLQKRLESFSEKFVETENKFNEQRRRCVNLEKQIEKSKLDSTSSNNKQKSVASTMMAATLDQYKIEELETSLLIQKDENDAIKAALKSTLEAKEEDLRLYVEMLESTKRVFLDGLKEFKQLTNK